MKKNTIDISYIFSLVVGTGIIFSYLWFALGDIPTLLAQTIRPLSGIEIKNTASESQNNAFQSGSMPVLSPQAPAETLNVVVKQPVVTKSTTIHKTATVTAPRHVLTDEERYLNAKALEIWPQGERPSYVNGHAVLYPQLKKICACESSYHGKSWDVPRQYENGKVIQNYTGSDDVGMCQINISAHGAMASELGYDLNSSDGNINFSNWLFEQEGSAPWYKSQKCWLKSLQTN